MVEKRGVTLLTPSGEIKKTRGYSVINLKEKRWRGGNKGIGSAYLESMIYPCDEKKRRTYAGNWRGGHLMGDRRVERPNRDTGGRTKRLLRTSRDESQEAYMAISKEGSPNF